MQIGHVMIDLDGMVLNQQEKELIEHPQAGGIILFSRNYESKKQLQHLIKDIRQIKTNCIIAVDQEGGRVQRFRNQFLPLPAFKYFGDLYEKEPSQALDEAYKIAKIMADELIENGVNISFTPVLDLNYGYSEVIGDRSFHQKTDIVINLGRSFIKGMKDAGMPATGKHFPGHGAVVADSHLTLPIDNRNFETIYQQDMMPFIALIAELDAVMPAHILYEKIDAMPTCFSNFWLKNVLRNQLNFNGVIFSDDLSMRGAECIGDYPKRAETALQAGCDMILVCNNRDQAINVLEHLEKYQHRDSQHRLTKFLVEKTRD